MKIGEIVFAFLIWAIFGIYVLNPLLYDNNFSGYAWFGELLLGNWWIDIPIVLTYQLLKELGIITR